MGLQHDLENMGILLDVDNGPVFTRAPTFNEAPLVGTSQVVQVAKVALAAVDTGGGLFAWQNPEDVSVLIHSLTINLTTKATGACTADCGTTATSATTLSDNLIDGLDINAATGVFNNADNAGTNGKNKQVLASGKWVTGSVASGASAGIVGYALIEYSKIAA